MQVRRRKATVIISDAICDCGGVLNALDVVPNSLNGKYGYVCPKCLLLQYYDNQYPAISNIEEIKGEDET